MIDEDALDYLEEIFYSALAIITTCIMLFIVCYYNQDKINTYLDKMAQTVAIQHNVKHYEKETIPLSKEPTVLPVAPEKRKMPDIPRMECTVPERYWLRYIPCTKYGDYI